MTRENMLDVDFFEIHDNYGEKYIHIFGYAYYVGDSVTDNPDEIYRQVDYCGFELPLEEYLSDEFDYDNYACGIKQYITDMTETEVEEWIEDNMKDSKPITDLTMETPCGFYY